ncbi:MAG TPA: molecular chaperone HtpG [bacterium]|nr:molecular chaperone HtpG [bacterium]
MSVEPNSSPTPRPQPGAGETHAFQAEMQQLLQIIIHSLYSDREIFLRELISNAADAINKLKFELLTHQDVRDRDAELEITLELDKDAHAVTVTDTGIGMTRDELARNLGTIARSGTLEFVKAMSASEPGQRGEMIGQFGVGFYSVFMVAKRVQVDSCPADAAQPATRWSSSGDGQYTLESSPRTRRGTAIRVELKPGCEEFSTAYRVEEVVKRYSTFVPHPIRLDGRRLNTQDAIWAQGKEGISQEQYRDFYQFVTHDADAPLHAFHLSIDAPVQFKALLFIPRHLTNEVLYSPRALGLQLYASRVMIQERSEDVLPLYLRFLRGVVDSEDLPLNVSREMVQQSPVLAKLRQSLTGRVLRELQSLAESNAELYRQIWMQYGKVLKEGVTGDQAQRDRLLELARFNSSLCKSADELITLKDYVGRMRDGQNEILYFTGPSREAIERNPNLEYFRKNGLEVLYLFDRGVDDFMMAGMQEYSGKRFASIDTADLEAFKSESFKAPEAPAGAEPLSQPDLDALLAFLRTHLGERVGGVTASKRLVESPATLVTADALPSNLQKMMQMLDKSFKATPKTLEINPAHPLIRDMAHMVKQPEQALLKDLADQLLDNCLIVEGLLEHPERMVGRIQDLMTRAAAAAARASL